jgi:membrane-associated protease RseP (regulator of RpoE activity)
MDQMALFFFLLGTGLVAVLFVHELGHLLVARHGEPLSRGNP